MSKLTPQQFVANWAHTQLKESASYVTHFDDLCELVGYPKPAHADKTGETFTYQKGVLKNAGGQDIGRGFADVWHRGRFAVEYKSAGKYKTLSEALKQLQGYCGALENPPLLMVCDIEHYEIYTNFNGAVTKIYRFTNADIASPRGLPRLWRRHYKAFLHKHAKDDSGGESKLFIRVSQGWFKLIRPFKYGL